MRRLLISLMALTAVQVFVACSSKKDEPVLPAPPTVKPEPPRPLTSVEYVTGKKDFTSQASGIKLNGGPMGQLPSEQNATLTFSSDKEFSFVNVIKTTAMDIPFTIKVTFSGTYTGEGTDAISLQARGETFKLDIDAEFPLGLESIIKWGITRSIGLTKDGLDKSPIPCKLDQAKGELELAYPADWKTPMTNAFVLKASAELATGK